jgi:hypothetical protein
MEQGSDGQGGNPPHGGHSAGRELGLSLEMTLEFSFNLFFMYPVPKGKKNSRLITSKVLLFVLWAENDNGKDNNYFLMAYFLTIQTHL